MALLPKDTPVTGQDLDALRGKLGLSVADMCWVFGFSMNRWGSTVRKNAVKPLPNQSEEILARLLDEYVELCPVPKMPDPREFFEHLKAIDPGMNRKRFGILLGREASTGYRWITKSGRPSPVLERIAFIVSRLLDDKRHTSDKRQVIAEWEALVRLVAGVRGIEGDILRTGRWTEPTRRLRARTRKSPRT